MSLSVLLVRLGEFGLRLRECRRGNKGADHRATKIDQKFSAFHTCKSSINSSTSRRFSGEILPEPLWAPLYCHSSLCSKRRRNWSRELSSSLNVSAAVSASTMLGSTSRLPDASAAFT